RRVGILCHARGRYGSESRLCRCLRRERAVDADQLRRLDRTGGFPHAGTVRLQRDVEIQVRWLNVARNIRGAAQVAFCVRVRLCEHEHGLARREIETVAGTACEEAHVFVRLSLIRLEVQGQLAVALAQAGLRSRGEWQGKTRDKREQHEDPARWDTSGLRHRYPL